jgi:DNA-binding response OmpR family regulator
MLPGLDGVGLARRVRVETTDIPILMMSARSDPIDIVSGLEAGADDYVTKPFDSAVLVARIRALLRRSARPAPAEQPEDTVRRFGDVTLDTASMQVCRNGEPVPLTPTELRLLLEFSAQPGVLLDRETLLQRVWDYSWDGDTRVVDIHIQRLRAKIGADAIDTVRGFGYRLKK